MTCRRIKGLLWARTCDRPKGLPWVQSRGAKAAGLRYEQKLAKGIWKAAHGQWWQFSDSGGLGHCQTDVLVQLDGRVLVLEAKYTWTEEGHRQCEDLYLPVVSCALGLPVIGVQVCKILTPDTPRGTVARTLDEASVMASHGRRTCLHWLGADLRPLQYSPSLTHRAPSRAVA